MKTIRPLLLALLTVLMPTAIHAYDFMVDGLCYNINDDGETVTVTYQNPGSPRYSSLSGALSIPSSVTSSEKSYKVTSIGHCAFEGCTGLTSVTIPNSVTYIGAWAFSCEGLSSIFIPNSVEYICEAAFDGCTGLTAVNISDIASWCEIEFEFIVGAGRANPLEYAHHLYLNGIEVKDLVIPNSVTLIGNYAFINCTGLTSVTIPNSVTSIGDGAFEFCSGLTSVTIPNSVTFIGNYAFINCTGLTSVTIPNSVTSVGDWVFGGCNPSQLTLTGGGKWDNDFGLNVSQLNRLDISGGITAIEVRGLSPDTMYSYATVPPKCNYNSFASYNGELHVPSNSTVAYLTAPYWQNFTNLNNDIISTVALDYNRAEIAIGCSLQLTPTTTPSGNTLEWSSTNSEVASVDNNGKVTAVGLGECDIFASFTDNPAVCVSCHVTVTYPEITDLTLNEESIEFNAIGDTFTLIATTTPENVGPAPTWISSDETVATVDDNGVVTSVGQGECDITAKVLDKTATCHVTVNDNIIISLDVESMIITPNKLINLTPSFSPIETDIVASSSDQTVAFARAVRLNGAQLVQVVGIGNGTATITVESADGKATPATCVVKVRGDLNNDHRIDGSDLNAMIDIVLGKQDMSEFADMNDDGTVDGTDLNLLINVVLGK